MSYSSIQRTSPQPMSGLGSDGGAEASVFVLLLMSPFIGAVAGAVLSSKHRVLGGVGGAVAMPLIVFSGFMGYAYIEKAKKGKSP